MPAPSVQSRLADNSASTSHEGPVWSVSWAHPKFGTFLASSSYAGTINIHRETPPTGATATSAGGVGGQGPTGGSGWVLAHTSTAHAASVNAVAWAPHEAGC